MTNWRVNFFGVSQLAGEASGGGAACRAGGTPLDRRDRSVELEGGIEPFANHRTFLERLELVIDPSAHLLERESALA